MPARRDIPDDGPVRNLLVGEVDLRLACLLEPADAHVCDDAHDLAVVERDLEPPAERALSGPVPAGEGLAYDDDERHLRRIGLGDVAAGAQGNSHRVEKPGRHEPKARRMRLLGVLRLPLGRDAPDSSSHHHGQAARVGRVGDSRQRPHVREDPPVEERALLCRPVTRKRQIRAQRQDSLRSETGVHGLEPPERAQEQPRADQERDGRGHLGDDEESPEPLCAARSVGARAVSQTAHLGVGAGAKSRSHAEPDAGHARQEDREDEDRKTHSGSSETGREIGIRRDAIGTAAVARARPRAPPTTARTRLSVMSCRASRCRPAPIAILTASSLRRESARASRRFARFVHAIRRSPSAAPKRAFHSPSLRTAAPGARQVVGGEEEPAQRRPGAERREKIRIDGPAGDARRLSLPDRASASEVARAHAS